MDREQLDYDKDAALIRVINLPQMENRALTELDGICAAIAYDRTISPDELKMLSQWLASRSEFRNAWPMCKVCDLVEGIINAGGMTEASHHELLAFISSISADAQHSGNAADSIFDENPVVTFEGKTFLFTGSLTLCKRADAMAAVTARGGLTTNSPSRKVNYLVVGDLGSEAWQHSRYGTKIRAIVENRMAGQQVLIIREAEFADALQKQSVIRDASQVV